MNAPEEKSVYAYEDYRLFVRDRMGLRRHTRPDESTRQFAARAGFSNPGFVGDVIKGRRGLSVRAREKLATALGLTSSERDFFGLLVEYGQAKKEDVRKALFAKIAFRRSRSLFARLNPALARYYQDYRYPLVFNAIMACDFKGDYELLASFLYPPIPAHELKKIVADLIAWGLVIETGGMSFRTTDRFIEPPEEMREQVRRLNREWILQAARALSDLPASKRHISSMLVSISPQLCKEISKKIETFRAEVWEMVKNDPHDPSVVMQLNLQYFPHSRKKESS